MKWVSEKSLSCSKRSFNHFPPKRISKKLKSPNGEVGSSHTSNKSTKNRSLSKSKSTSQTSKYQE